MRKSNCWEVKGCGREPGGKNIAQLGACPAAADERFNGVNQGKNGGRACWAIAGTLCGGTIQGTFATKLGSCMKCEFYKTVVREEGREIATARAIQALADD